MQDAEQDSICPRRVVSPIQDALIDASRGTPRRAPYCNIGALIIRIGFGVYYTIAIIRSP